VILRSFNSRLVPLLFALLLLLLQSAAPLLHAHAADDPRALALSGLHLPGLEPVVTVTGSRDVVSERVYPLIEEAECWRQRVVSDAIARPAVPDPWPRDGGAGLRIPLRSAAPHATTDCAPPPTRAPPAPSPA
jgi:hypothetical protein